MVVEQAAVKALFTEKASELLNNKMYRLTEPQNATKRLVFQLIKVVNRYGTLVHVLNQQPERAFASQGNFR